MTRARVGLAAVALFGCSSDATLPPTDPPPRSVRQTVRMGVVDTIRLDDVVSAIVDNSRATTDVDLELSSIGSSGLLPVSATLGGGILRVHATSNGTSSSAAGIRDGDPETLVTILVNALPAGVNAIRNFLVGSSTTTPLWTTATGTQYLDPVDGTLKSVETIDLLPDITQTGDYLLQLVEVKDDCDLPPRLIDYDHDRPGTNNSTPLILIHGWQPTMLGCRGTNVSSQAISLVSYYDKWDRDDNASPFEQLLADLNQPIHKSLRDNYHIYIFHYPTYRSVLVASAALRDALRALPGKPPVIVAHSMGGLVARGMLSLAGAPAIRGLVTIGTPHRGTAIASILAGTSAYSRDEIENAEAECKWWQRPFPRIARVLGGLLTLTPGLRDLAEESALVSLLEDNRPSQERIYTLGGSISPARLDPLVPFACVLAGLPGSATASDGVVPVHSALPTWSAGQHLFDRADHNELLATDLANNQVVPVVRDALSRFATCLMTTPPLTPGNPFTVSGSIARTSDNDVDITLNGIVIDGAVRTGLTKANFTIVENGCAIPPESFDLSTGEGSVGVDIVFVQDLSSSMGNVITGVRQSVNSFAGALAAEGFDVRFGSVGYSGSGTIPTSPPSPSSCEDLGPVRDLTNVSSFLIHVTTQWYSYGGCDVPENGLEGIEYAMNQLSWRSGAARILIDITNSGHHTATDSCNASGPCTDETLESIAQLLVGRAVLHAVAPGALSDRTQSGSLDPWLIASATGGKSLVLGNGVLNLNEVGVADAIAATTRLTFRSASSSVAPGNLRVLVTIDGQTSELSPGLLAYSRVHPSLVHGGQGR